MAADKLRARAHDIRDALDMLRKDKGDPLAWLEMIADDLEALAEEADEQPA